MTIKELRSVTNLSQSQFASMFKIPVNTLQRWEINYRKPPEYVPYLIEEVLKAKGYLGNENN